MDTDELETWDVTLDLLSPGGRAAFEDELVVFEALGFRDIPGLVGPALADRAMASKAFWEPIVAVKADTRVALQYVNALDDADMVRQVREALIRAVLGRL